jgi:1-aminocyclopropane-1-carboxylate deaminase
MQALNEKAITIDPVIFPLAGQNITFDVLRLDKIHPVISGNKWFKLKYYLEEAKALKAVEVISFGGAWSNHIVALAAAGKLFSIKTTGIIRGERPEKLSSTLQASAALGMALHFINRADFKQKKIPVNLRRSGALIIPEGGYGLKGAAGASDILSFVRKEKYTHICCAAGTGTMAAGLVNAALPEQTVIAVNVLKNEGLEAGIRALTISQRASLLCMHDYHFGGYAKYTHGLIAWMNEFYRSTLIPTDFVYTAKLFFAVEDMVRKKKFPEGSRILIIHSGGLQGNASLEKGTLIF